MKLSKIKKLVLSLLLLNTLVACKYQVGFEQAESENNGIEGFNTVEPAEEIYEQAAEILVHNYEAESKELNLTILTNSYTGDLEADLEMSHCTKSYPSTCYAVLNVLAVNSGAEIDGDEAMVSSVLIKREVTINLSDLDGVSILNISDDARNVISVQLDQIEKERVHTQIFIENVTVDQDRGEFTITAKHQVCDGPGELDLDDLNTISNGLVPVEKRVANADEAQPIQNISVYYPEDRSVRLVYKVVSGHPEVACLTVIGHYQETVKTFSFKDAGIPEGQSLKISDATKKLTVVTNKAMVKINLLPIKNIRVDLKESLLIVESSFNVQGKMNMEPCMAIDPLPNQTLLVNQTCTANFESDDLILVDPPIGLYQIIAAPLNKSIFTLSEVGLGQNGSSLIINFRDGRATVTIDRLGKVTVSMELYAIVHN